MPVPPERIAGSIAPVVTPFDDSGAVDLYRLSALIEWQISSGSHGISVMGTTGEPSALSIAERKSILRETAVTVGQRRPFVPGTGTNNLEETLELTQAASKEGADAALVIVPYYNRPSQEGLYRYFCRVARSSDLPIIVYNIPGRTGVNLSPETLARIRESCPNVVGVKEANKDLEHVTLVLRRCGLDFRVYSGIEMLCYPILAIGGVGYISATANVLPRPVASLYDAFASGDFKRAQAIHYSLLDVNEALFVETNPGPVKWAMSQLGLLDCNYRLPLCVPSEGSCARIRSAMIAYGMELSTA